MSLTRYKQKRNFSNTPEPVAAKGSKNSKLSFVVQRHAASHLHYDFRLEMEGVLKSWAVPKGPSMKAGERRLAVFVEDHPLKYGKFYGEIPKGNYGAGIVDIWDEGTYQPLEETKKGSEEKLLLQQLKKGDLKFSIDGKHLKGAFALVRMNDGQDKNWLLIKKKDEFIKSSYDIEKIKPLSLGAKTKNVWGKKEKIIEEVEETVVPVKKTKGVNIDTVWPKLNKPMLAKLIDGVEDQDDWIYEMKYDGYRAVTKVSKLPAGKAGKKVEMISRNGNSFNNAYPSLIKELEKISEAVILDGEIVIEDKKGSSDFQLLQNYGSTQKGILKYYVFDILFLEGHSIVNIPLVQRKELLTHFFKKYKFKNIHEAPFIKGKGKALFKKASAKGMEGIIAKDENSPYGVGKRTDSWLKIKTVQLQEAVICGYTLPQNSRDHFGALILGVNEGKKLRYIGNCGTGFTHASLKELHTKLTKLETSKSPFEDSTKIGVSSRWGKAIGKPVWVKPVLVCNVKFQEWTDNGHMRIPVFAGLRTDKNANQVIKEDKIKGMVAKQEKPKAIGSKKKTVSAISPRPKKVADSPDAKEKITNIGGKEVKLTNLTKVYWPREKYTKGDLINYYSSISKYILPYLKNRPQSLNRHPNGISAPGFYQKDMDVKQIPSWAKTARIYSKHNKDYIDYLICNDEATLVYMANLGCIEINPWHSKHNKPDHPDYLILDLDPGNISFKEVVKTALVLKRICDEIKIDCYCKTSGATGLHVYISLGAKYTYDEVKIFAEWMARKAHEYLPKTTSIERSVAKRKDKIYLDFLQNNKGQTIASVYSVRPREHATVSTPLLWREINTELDPKKFTMFNIEKRLAKVGDLWKGVLQKPVDLKRVLKIIEAL